MPSAGISVHAGRPAIMNVVVITIRKRVFMVLVASLCCRLDASHRQMNVRVSKTCVDLCVLRNRDRPFWSALTCQRFGLRDLSRPLRLELACTAADQSGVRTPHSKGISSFFLGVSKQPADNAAFILYSWLSGTIGVRRVWEGQCNCGLPPRSAERLRLSVVRHYEMRLCLGSMSEAEPLT